MSSEHRGSSGDLASDWIERLSQRLHGLDAPNDSGLVPVDSIRRSDIADLLPSDRPPRPAAVLVPIRIDCDPPRVVLTRRADHLSTHSGQIGFPGGRIEPDDAGPVAAALRESHEEIGLPSDRVRPLGFLDPVPTISGFLVQPVVGLVEAEFEARLDPGEVAEVFEVPLEFLVRSGSPRRVQAQYRGRLRTWHELIWHNRLIWGVTAEIILDLRSRFS